MDQLEQNMLAMQQKMQRTDVENNQIQQVKDLLDQGLLKINQDQIIEPVADPEESEMLRLSQFDDAESKLAVEDLAQRIESKRRAQVFHVDIQNQDMDEKPDGGDSSLI